MSALGRLEQLTEDHRVVVSSAQTYLGHALGANQQVEIDYRAVPLGIGDAFVFNTEGVYAHVNPHFIGGSLAAQRKK